MGYEEKTVWVYNNLQRGLIEKINIEIIDIIIDLQSEYVKSHSELTDEQSIIFIIGDLKKINIVNLKNSDIEEIINKVKQFEYKS